MSPQLEPTTTLFVYIILQSLCTHLYKFTNSGTMWPLHPTISEVLYLQLPFVHLHCHLHWRPWLMQVRTSWGVAISCGIGIRPWVIEGETFLLFHGCPPILQSSSPTWSWLFFPFTLLKLRVCRQQFGVHFFLFLFFLQFFFLLFLIFHL